MSCLCGEPLVEQFSLEESLCFTSKPVSDGFCNTCERRMCKNCYRSCRSCGTTHSPEHHKYVTTYGLCRWCDEKRNYYVVFKCKEGHPFILCRTCYDRDKDPDGAIKCSECMGDNYFDNRFLEYDWSEGLFMCQPAQ